MCVYIDMHTLTFLFLNKQCIALKLKNRMNHCLEHTAWIWHNLWVIGFPLCIPQCFHLKLLVWEGAILCLFNLLPVKILKVLQKCLLMFLLCSGSPLVWYLHNQLRKFHYKYYFLCGKYLLICNTKLLVILVFSRAIDRSYLVPAVALSTGMFSRPCGPFFVCFLVIGSKAGSSGILARISML